MTDRSTFLIDKKVELRPDQDGGFDELLLHDGKHCVIHAEMMDDNCLWIGIYPRGEKTRQVAMWITAKKGKLVVNAAED